ncbi:hypothetical protein FGIG_08243 [Fasciola gigantica]|uniref:G-protein coupled receptors family 1 profile domain-containing protein n=1 Tax=Fasciola gigantica TaxID=46835 RepID=A0A504YFQ5_FASGI|nr:hypothetical protein FGIG_08243 [Fasciola gigantica]
MVDFTFNPNQTINYAVGVSCTIPLIIGIVINILIFCALKAVTISGRLTTWLLSTQMVLDTLSCMSNMLFLWMRHYPYTNYITGWIQCRIWRTQTPYWLWVTMSTCNLAWINLNRLWATVYCATYGRYEKAYIIWTTFGTIAFSVAIVIPNMFIVEFENLSCTTMITPDQTLAYRITQVYQPFWCVTYFLFPIVVMLVAHLGNCILRLRTSTYHSSIFPYSAHLLVDPV